MMANDHVSVCQESLVRPEQMTLPVAPDLVVAAHLAGSGIGGRGGGSGDTFGKEGGG